VGERVGAVAAGFREAVAREGTTARTPDVTAAPGAQLLRPGVVPLQAHPAAAR